MEKMPSFQSVPSQDQQKSIDQQFASQASRWFNVAHESDMKEIQRRFGNEGGGNKSERDELLEDAFRYQELGRQLAVLADPRRIESTIKREGLDTKYGDEAEAVFVAEAMGTLGFRMGQIPYIRKSIDDPSLSDVKEINQQALTQNSEAKKLFLAAAEKLYGNVRGEDTYGALLNVIGEYKSLAFREGRYKDSPDATSYFAGSSVWMDRIKDAVSSSQDRLHLLQLIDEGIEHLAGEIGELAWSRAHEDERGNKGYHAIPNDTRLAISYGNKLLYRFQKIRDQFES